jgi:class 3 adenylate cyclase
MYYNVEELADLAKVDLFIVTNGEGRLLAWLDEPERFGEDLSGLPTINRALQGEFPEIELTTPELWTGGGQVFQIVSAPVFLGDNIIGSITLGALIGEKEAFALKGDAEKHITFFRDSLMFASTFDSTEILAMQRFYQQNSARISTLMTSQRASEAFEFTLNSDEYFAFLSPLGKGVDAYYLAAVEKESQLTILDTLQLYILIIAIISLVLGVSFGFLFGRSFSRPILRLAKGMSKVEAGDLNQNVRATTKDEIGDLTNAFNNMVVGLRERLHLSKYVGSHTLDMVRKSGQKDIALGGERRDITTLFSDIRGFTRFSATREPEEIIGMLNRFLGMQAEVVDLFEGSVDKFVGDEMVALFTGKDGLSRAMHCAVKIQKIITNELRNADGQIGVGIGINYGPVVIGNMGAKDRMDYTVIGSSVNLGARLCSAAKAGQILVPESLVRENSDFKYGETIMMSFKGLDNEIAVAEVLDEAK